MTIGPPHFIWAPRGEEARGAEPERARSSAVEHLTFNQRVVGSIPTRVTITIGWTDAVLARRPLTPARE